ncbi:hypothetical protein LPJ59_004045 [Coemansia sp. RSA 2399]|nr:hypothetical protein LPJ59_004045 [Coemansia sp. RSA 2399]KAJ1901551.1 hypothetical protein LPJ81_003735 [Coemansia sp. IMI 209127]
MRISPLLTAAAGLAGTVFSAVIPEMRVTNGTLSPQGEAPYFAQILVRLSPDREARCGATIIDETTVITAGHCVYNATTQSLHPTSAFTIIYGSVKLSQGTSIKATNVTVHPNFTGKGHLYYDIAVIQVPKIILKPGSAETITVYDGNIIPHEEMDVFGWGLTVTGGSVSDLPPSLLTQRVFVGEPSNCQSIEPLYQGANGPLICADNNYNVGVDVCQGDSGTGTTINSDGKAYYAGLVSYGTDKEGDSTCGQAGSFGMYTRPYYYVNWIESVIGHPVITGPGNAASLPASTSSASSAATPVATSTSSQTPAPQPTSSCYFFIFCF